MIRKIANRGFLTGLMLLHLVTYSLGQNADFDVINSSADELNPVLTNGGKTIYFIRKFHPGNAGGMKDPGDIWISHRSDSLIWQPAERIPDPVNNKQFNGVIGLIMNGRKVYLYEHYMPGGAAARTQGISSSINNEGSWSTPSRIDIKYFYNRSEHISISISKDERIMLLALESYGTLGAEDIYVSFKTGNDIWTEPKNIGSDINTKFQEMTPYLSPDNKTLFFASNGHGGFGGRDIFISKRQDDTWRNWSSPQNLGSKVNTEGVELYFQYFPGEETAVYTSTQSSDGYSDLKLVHFSKNDLEEILGDSIETVEIIDTELISEIRENVPVSNAEFRVTGNVIESITDKPLAATISIANQKYTQVLEVSDSGVYSITIPTSGVYEVIVESDGYVSVQELLDIRVSEMGTITHDFVLQPIMVGTTVALDNVLFVRGSTELLETSYGQLDLVVKMMNQNPEMEIYLAGHTDNQGSQRLNEILSQQRVDEVIEYIRQHGIGKSRLSGKGFGGSNPIASNEVEETRQLNRRVEFTIVKN